MKKMTLRSIRVTVRIIVTENALIAIFEETAIMKKGILIFLLILSAAAVSAHPWKPRHYVIADSDGGLDDLKAI
ncbi:MAG: hypothetical protein IH593_09305, partial [Bacteroidales bacterium]|nr:hypothetical protein [Bacteroidales bacterium]